MRNPGVVFVAKQAVVFYPLFTRRPLIVPFCLVLFYLPVMLRLP